jgi:hypothetical protein
MKFALLFVLFLICGLASAESINVSNYNIVFNMSQTYEVTMPQSEMFRNGTGVRTIDMISINASNGYVVMVIGTSNFTDQRSVADVFETLLTTMGTDEYAFPHSIDIDNKKGWYAVYYTDHIPSYVITYYIIAPLGTDYYTEPNGATAFVLILSSMPLYDTADFFRTLHIRPIT